MKHRIILATILLFLFAGLSPRAAQAATQLSIYVVPAITDNKILPWSPIGSEYLTNVINITACPGESESASFVVRPDSYVNNLQVIATDLTKGSDLIPSSNIDISVVKTWYQAGNGNDVWNDITGKHLTPELLLKDDSLVKVENGENYLWNGATGSYVWISERQDAYVYSIPISELSIMDSQSLQPVDIPANTNKQFWIDLTVPEGQASGTYTGLIKLIVGATTIAELQLQVVVLPFELSSSPMMIFGLYCWFQLEEGPPGISSYNKTETQYRAEIQSMINHGIKDFTVGPQSTTTKTSRLLSIRQSSGITGPLFYTGTFNWEDPPQTPGELNELKSQVTQTVNLARNYGVTDVYFQGIHEPIPSLMLAEIPALQAILEAGGKVWSSSHWNYDPYPYLGDYVDVINRSWPVTSAQAIQWHNSGKRIVAFGSPQAGLEKPETYRRQYGLRLWQADFDGFINFAWMWSAESHPWNDFDTADTNVRDHNMVYPTNTGVIETIQLKGMREAIDDMRYIYTLLERVAIAKSQGEDTSIIDNWLSNLKNEALTNIDLDMVRSEIINYILSLQNLEPLPPSPISLPMRVNTGGNAYTDNLGNAWNADQAYTPGSWGFYGQDRTSDRGTAYPIGQTVNDRIYQTQRYDLSGYRFDLGNGTYTVILHFAETYGAITGPGQRVFDVLMEGQIVLDNLDIYSRVGHSTALTIEFNDITIQDGQLDISFVNLIELPEINGIEILPA